MHVAAAGHVERSLMVAIFKRAGTPQADLPAATKLMTMMSTTCRWRHSSRSWRRERKSSRTLTRSRLAHVRDFATARTICETIERTCASHTQRTLAAAVIVFFFPAILVAGIPIYLFISPMFDMSLKEVRGGPPRPPIPRPPTRAAGCPAAQTCNCGDENVCGGVARALQDGQTFGVVTLFSATLLACSYLKVASRSLTNFVRTRYLMPELPCTTTANSQSISFRAPAPTSAPVASFQGRPEGPE